MPAAIAADNADQKTDRFASRLFVVLVALSVFSIMLTLAGRYFGHTIALAGFSDRSHPRELVVGNAVLLVPENFIRFPDQRADGIVRQLELFARWPAMTGYSRSDAAAFNGTGDSHPLIFISVAPKQLPRDMSRRFEPIYSKLIDATAVSGPGGLTGHPFKPGSAVFQAETLWSSPPIADTGLPWVARCLEQGDVQETADNSRAIAPCQRDVDLDDMITVNYRFSDALLPYWDQLDSHVLGLVNTFVANASRMSIK